MDRLQVHIEALEEAEKDSHQLEFAFGSAFHQGIAVPEGQRRAGFSDLLGG